MNIRDVDDKGYFKDEFDFGETLYTMEDFKTISEGIFTFLGKLNYKIFVNKSRILTSQMKIGFIMESYFWFRV